MAEQDTPPPTITAMKIPIIRKGEYDIWSMRMRQYICHTDHNLWDVIVNGDLEEEPAPTGETSAPPAPKTAKQLAAKRNQERVKSILLLAIPDEYLLKFHNVADAKSLWAAIKGKMFVGCYRPSMDDLRKSFRVIAHNSVADHSLLGEYKIGNVMISRVYYVEGLGHNLFSISQFCDSNLEVDFRQHTYFISLNLEGFIVLSSWVKELTFFSFELLEQSTISASTVLVQGSALHGNYSLHQSVQDSCHYPPPSLLLIEQTSKLFAPIANVVVAPEPAASTGSPLLNKLLTKDAPSPRTHFSSGLSDGYYCLKWIIYKVWNLIKLRGILKNKARLVARGYRQEEIINFEESFALVAILDAI
ncbi:hypothetical protein Tco_0627010 [Tanacetum coccineum]|uniref:Uncharacterized protein n=1 Tax=Tanacetum coccineum TaxID=301880 RepID=A0ABQ4WLG8_9ASTR